MMSLQILSRRLRSQPNSQCTGHIIIIKMSLASSVISSEEPSAKVAKLEETNDDQGKVESIEAEPLPFSSPWHFSDVVLMVEGRKFHVHKCTLSMWSPVFETMFTSEFKEKSSTEIELPGKSAKEIEVLLKLICFKSKQSVTYDNFAFLLQLADEYQMAEVKELCVEFMQSTLNKDNCLHFCQVADHNGLDDVKSKCVSVAKLLTLSKIEGSTDFTAMNPDMKYEILTQRIQSLENILREVFKECPDIFRHSKNDFYVSKLKEKVNKYKSIVI